MKENLNPALLLKAEYLNEKYKFIAEFALTKAEYHTMLEDMQLPESLESIKELVKLFRISGY